MTENFLSLSLSSSPFFPPSFTTRNYNEKTAIASQGESQHLDLGLPSLQHYAKQLLFKATVYDILWQQMALPQVDAGHL